MSRCILLVAYLEILFGSIFFIPFLATFFSVFINESYSSSYELFKYLFFTFLSLLHIVLGVGIIKEKEWAFKVIVCLSVIRLIAIPIGTIWGIWAIKCIKNHLESRPLN